MCLQVDSPFDLLLKRYPFVLDGEYCSCLLSFFQSLKFSKESEQKFVCRLNREDDLIKISDLRSSWKETMTLYWKEVSYHRMSEEYQELISCAFTSACLHPDFQKVLCSVDASHFDLIVRPVDPTKTVLTKEEARKQFLRLHGGLMGVSQVALVVPMYNTSLNGRVIH